MERDRLPENNLIATQTVTDTTAATHIQLETATGDNGLMGLLLMGMLIAAGFHILYRNSSLYLDRAVPLRSNLFKKLAQPHCQKCRFYDSASDFKCTVHPFRLNLNQAKNCPDYWQRDKRKFLHH